MTLSTYTTAIPAATNTRYKTLALSSGQPATVRTISVQTDTLHQYTQKLEHTFPPQKSEREPTPVYEPIQEREPTPPLEDHYHTEEELDYEEPQEQSNSPPNLRIQIPLNPPSNSSSSSTSSSSGNMSNPTITEIQKAFSAVTELKNNSTNFEVWRARVRAAVRSLDTLTILDTAHASTNYDQRVAAAIQGKLQSNLFMLVNVFTTCYEIMSDLTKCFGQTTTVVTVDAERQLFLMKCQSDGNVSKHLDDLERQYDHLTSLGRTIDDDTWINIIIASLPAAYRPTIDSLSASIEMQNKIGTALSTAYTPVTLTPSAVLAAIRAEALSRNLRTGKSSDNHQSNCDSKHDKKSQHSASIAESRPSRGGFHGQGCRQGHRGRSHGPSSSNRNTDSSTTPSSITCYNCGGKGHLSAKCPSPHRQKTMTTYAAVADGAKPTTTPALKPSTTTTTSAAHAAGPAYAFNDGQWSAMATIEELVEHAFTIEEQPTTFTEIWDSRATCHMSPYRWMFDTFEPYADSIRLADSTSIPVEGKGTMSINTLINGHWTKIRLLNVHYAPSFRCTLVSLSKFVERGFSIVINTDGMNIIAPNRRDHLAIIPCTNGLYRVAHTPNQIPINLMAFAAMNNRISLKEVHERLGHISYRYIERHLNKENNYSFYGLKIDMDRMDRPICESCLQGKIVRASIAKHRASPRTAFFGDVIHMDVWGPAPVRTLNQHRYTVTMVDEAIGWLEEPLLHLKDGAFTAFVAFHAICHMQYGVSIKMVHSDRGGEFLGNNFMNFLTSEGIQCRLTVHDTPEHNGIAEHTHCMIFGTIRTLLAASKLPPAL
ncbi:hypothetical protein NM688_g6325 [Phlebia brevispora]|uniref:Uncharacterized protein n=1 Tax=Phlebia brevispora TaxID=194682 RepID=A0ACC1SHI9_9APHY|nr:hypothetical protein NM688_g6325 [Phlebia brevispora]